MTKDVEFGGETCARGRSSCCSTRRPTATSGCSTDPERFDITRSPNDHVAFGFGSHFCLGNRLARMELSVMFDRLLDRLPDLALADDDEPPKRAANFVSGYETMPVVFTPTARCGASA